jgi:predicted dehydrogenase
MNLNRRNFLFGSAAATALAGCAMSKGMAPRTLKAGEKANVALIGYGIQQRQALLPQFANQYRRGAQIVAVCDCDKERREAGARDVDARYAQLGFKDVPPCKAVADFRDILNDPMIDMVCIATPDHWHAYMAVEAMKRGKDVYCEKPLTYNVDEARKVIAAQKKYNRVFQTGSMQRSWDVFRTATMIVRNGIIGDVKYVDANYGIGGKKLGGPSHPIRFFDKPENAAKEGAPNPNVDWDMWLGPCKWRPYSDQLAPRGVNKFYPMFWRFDDDIGTGYNGDWGAHHLDIAQWGLNMDQSGPYKIIRSEEPYSTDLFHGGRRQFGMKMLFKTPTGDVELYHGPFGVWGTVFYGTNGIVAVNRGKIAVWLGTGLVKPTAEVRKQLQDVSFMKDKIVAESVGKDYGTDSTVKKDNRLEACLKKLKAQFRLDDPTVAKDQLYKSPNQVQNFVECYFSRKETISPAEVGGRGAVLCQLCNMSYVYDTGFDWDPVKMDFANGTGKGIQLSRDYCRNGWEVTV